MRRAQEANPPMEADHTVEVPVVPMPDAPMDRNLLAFLVVTHAMG